MARLDPKAALAADELDELDVPTRRGELRRLLQRGFQAPRCATTYLTFADPSQEPPGPVTRAARAEGLPGVGCELIQAGVGRNGGRPSSILAGGVSLDKVDNSLPHSEYNSRWVTCWHNFARGAEDAGQFAAWVVDLVKLGADLDKVLGLKE